MDELGDPYATLLTKASHRSLVEQTNGSYAGIGVTLGVVDGSAVVNNVAPGSPAERAGLMTGDRIVAADSVSFTGAGSDSIVAALRGRPGSEVQLSVLRAGAASPAILGVKRAPIHVSAVSAAGRLPSGAGYIKVDIVSSRMAEEVASAIDSLASVGIHGLVIDLRGNLGGLLGQGVATADLFLPRGDTLLRTRGRARGMSQTWTDQHDARWSDLPIVILVDRYTASAAEIFAGAMQDYDRALLVGERTYGKGVAQAIVPINDTLYLKLTTTRWMTPSGRELEPAAEAPSDDERPRYRTVGRRTVLGGGGLVPEVEVAFDTLGSGGRSLMAALGRDGARELSATAVNVVLAERATATTPRMPSMGVMLSALRDSLAGRSVNVSDAAWYAGRDALERLLTLTWIEYTEGLQAKLLTRAANDGLVDRAADILARAERPADVFRGLNGTH